MAISVKWATGLGLRMLIIGGAFLGVAACAYASDQSIDELARHAEVDSAMLTCGEIEARFKDGLTEVLTGDILAARLQSMLADPEMRRLLEEENLTEKDLLEELRCSLLMGAWNIGVRISYRNFLKTIPAAKRPVVKERLFFHTLEQSIEASRSGSSIHGGTIQGVLDNVRTLLEDYLSPEELSVLTADFMLRAQFAESTRMSLDTLFEGEELADDDAEVIADAFGREQARAYQELEADPQNYDWNEGLVSAYERAMAELSQTLSAEAMEFAERFFEFYMKSLQLND